MLADEIRNLFPVDILPQVYIGEFPTDIDDCIAIEETGGPHGNFFGQDHLDVAYVRIGVRNQDYRKGYAQAYVCKQILSDYATTRPFGFALINDIMYFGRDDKRRNMFQLTFKVFDYWHNEPYVPSVTFIYVGTGLNVSKDGIMSVDALSVAEVEQEWDYGS